MWTINYEITDENGIYNVQYKTSSRADALHVCEHLTKIGCKITNVVVRDDDFFM